jgi:LmbE family N-acetylglucosaminyl deacetylase
VQQITTPKDIKHLGTIMSIWAHPDDESFCAGGIMTAAAKNKQKVICVTATKGEAGIQDESRWPAAKLGQIRAREMTKALRCLGVDEHIWLNYIDGHCAEVKASQAVGKIKVLIKHYQPDTILTFDPSGMTGHKDHKTISAWVSKAVTGSKVNVYHVVEEEERYLNYMLEADKKINIYFNIDKPPVVKASRCDIAFCLPKEVINKKRQSLKAMQSQTDKMFKDLPPAVLNGMLSYEYFVASPTK